MCEDGITAAEMKSVVIAWRGGDLVPYCMPNFAKIDLNLGI